MSKIKKVTYWNKKKLAKMVSCMKEQRNNSFLNFLSSTPVGFLHHLLPLKYKFLDESYILEQDSDPLGVITVSSIVGSSSKLQISQLLLADDSFSSAEQLINFVIVNYGANGATGFFATINENFAELINIFVNQCGFRQCSTEQIWEIPKISFKKSQNIKYRRFKNSDLAEISAIYNSTLESHYKPTLERTEQEFSEFLFNGLTYTSNFRYIIEDNSTSKIIGYFLISTEDNENFLVDFNYSTGYDVDFDGILYYATREILKRKRRFKLHIKIKNYLQTGKIQTEYAQQKSFECKNTKLMLIKDFYKVIKQTTPMKEFIVFKESY